MRIQSCNGSRKCSPAYYDNVIENPSFGFVLCDILPPRLINVPSLVHRGFLYGAPVSQNTLGCWPISLGIMYGTKEIDIIYRSAALAEKLPYVSWPRPVHVTAASVLVFGNGYKAGQRKVELHIRSHLIKALQMDGCWFMASFTL